MAILVTPVGVVGDKFGPGLLAVGELWFMLDTDLGWRRLLFDGVGVVRWCGGYGGYGGVGGDIGSVRECSVEELVVFREAVVRFLEDVGGGV